MSCSPFPERPVSSLNVHSVSVPLYETSRCFSCSFSALSPLQDSDSVKRSGVSAGFSSCGGSEPPAPPSWFTELHKHLFLQLSVGLFLHTAAASWLTSSLIDSCSCLHLIWTHEVTSWSGPELTWLHFLFYFVESSFSFLSDASCWVGSGCGSVVWWVNQFIMKFLGLSIKVWCSFSWIIW